MYNSDWLADASPFYFVIKGGGGGDDYYVWGDPYRVESFVPDQRAVARFLTRDRVERYIEAVWPNDEGLRVVKVWKK